MRVHSRTRPRGENGSYWTSYSDMMAGLMLVFALVMFFSIFQFLDLQETKTVELETKEQQLNEKEDQLQISLTNLALAQTQLEEQETLLQQSTLQLTTQQEALDEQALLLAASLEDLDAAQQALLLAQASLSEKEALLGEQESQLSAQREQMDAQQVKIDNLIGLRARIIQMLSEELRKANLDVEVDRQTGAITMKGAVLFDTGSDQLKDTGKALLDSFIPVYVRTLLSEENREYVGEIIIEGHADTDGDYLSNLNLSQRRALAVSTYCLEDGFGGLTTAEREELRTIMTANGRSWSNPIYNADGTVDKERSRRVEFKFRLKDAEMIDEMSSLLEESP